MKFKTLGVRPPGHLQHDATASKANMLALLSRLCSHVRRNNMIYMNCYIVYFTYGE